MKKRTNAFLKGQIRTTTSSQELRFLSTVCQAGKEVASGLLKLQAQPKSQNKTNLAGNWVKTLFPHSPTERQFFEEKEQNEKGRGGI